MANLNSILNPAQEEAVAHQGAHLIITAGPGTGKTHTLTQKILTTAPLLKKGQRILALTFTNKAAQEMRSRLLKNDRAVDQTFLIGTFHQFCLFVLKSYPEKSGLPENFSIAAKEDIEALLKDAFPEAGTRERKNILEEIQRQKSCGNADVTREAVLYQQALAARNLLDFDDILLNVLTLWDKYPAVLEKARQTYPFVFVDEYQDINSVQHGLLKRLVSGDVVLTAIGDPQQAIYGFRGADKTFFDSFEKDFLPARRLSLERNYRSCPNLLEASSQVIGATAALVADMYEQGQLIVHESPTDKAEAEYVVHEIEKMIGGTSMFSRDSGRVSDEFLRDVGFGDIAVFYRLNAQGRLLAQAFERSGIPYEFPKSREEDLRAHPDIERFDELYAKSERVQLMSMHASKGLEFPVVFIVGCEDNLVPLRMEHFATDEQEERRLFYVAMTRAKYRLVLNHARKRFLFGAGMENQISVFVRDIETALKEYHHTQVKKKRDKDRDQMKLF